MKQRIEELGWELGQTVVLGDRTRGLFYVVEDRGPIEVIEITPEVWQAIVTLRIAKDAKEWEDDPAMLDQLVPYAEILARAEGHRDHGLVLERELRL